MKSIRLFLPGEPVPRKDPKSCIMWVHGKTTSRLFQSTEYTRYKQRLARMALEIISAKSDWEGIFPLDEALIVGFTFWMPREEIIGHGDDRRKIFHAGKHHIIKPDTSNLIKAVEDSLSGVLWRDDSIIVGYDPPPYKYFATDGQAPGVEIIVEPYQNPSFAGKQAELGIAEEKAR